MIIFMIIVIGIFSLSTKVEAALQANGAAGITANLSDWMYYTRKMQETGGGLGLNDKISDTDLTSSNKNFDIHMQKNTEYGAIAILSASAYGNPNVIADGQTTTGNVSGIQVKLNGEWTAAAASNTAVWAMQVGKPRYWNNYGGGNGSNSKIGDAMAETNGWHGSSGAWMSHICASAERGTADCAFVRANGGSCFSFDGRSWYGEYWRSETYSKCHYHGGEQNNGGDCLPGKYTNAWYGRACVVVGSGV